MLRITWMEQPGEHRVRGEAMLGEDVHGQEEKAKVAPAGGSLTAVDKEKRVLATAVGRTVHLGHVESGMGNRTWKELKKRRSSREDSRFPFYAMGRIANKKTFKHVALAYVEAQDGSFTRHVCRSCWTAEERGQGQDHTPRRFRELQNGTHLKTAFKMTRCHPTFKPSHKLCTNSDTSYDTQPFRRPSLFRRPSPPLSRSRAPGLFSR